MKDFRAEDLRQSLIDAGIILYMYDISNKISRGIGATEHVAGMTEEEFNESDIHVWTDAMHPEDAEQIFKEQTKILAKGGPYGGEYRYKHKTDGYVLLRDQGFALDRNEETGISGKMIGMIKRLDDYTS